MEEDVIYEPPEDIDLQGVIVTFHGGCFTGGSTFWDVAQNKKLAARGFEVRQVYIPKTYDEFISDHAFNGVIEADVPVFVLGRSSGGYFAKIMNYFHHEIEKAAYICPVLKPISRAKMLPKYAKRTLEFFKLNVSVIDSYGCGWNNTTERLYLAENDDHVPLELFTNEQKESAIYIGPTTHNGMVNCASDEFINDITQWYLS